MSMREGRIPVSSLAVVVGAAAVTAVFVAGGRGSSSGESTTAKIAAGRTSGDVVVALPAELPHDAHQLGALVPSKTLQLGFALTPRDAAALTRAARSISTPGSTSYHHFLTPGAIALRFGPSSSTVRAVSHSLGVLGFHVGSISSNHLMLHVSGTVTTVEHALRAHLASVRLTGGSLGWRLVSRAMLPSAIGTKVSAIIGLNNVAIAHSMVVPPPITTGGSALGVPSRVANTRSSGCAGARSAARDEGGWTESQIASAYGLSRLYAQGDSASGQTIAVVELEPFVKSDIATFDRCLLGSNRTNQIHRVPIDGFNYTGSGSGESVLDIEALSALAPSAQINVYEAPNTTIGTLDAYNAIVSADNANLITTSWGECEQLFDASSPGARQVENFIFEEAAAQGQTVIAATGDSGSDDCATTPFGSDNPVAPYLSVDDPASQPYVLAVGGTALRSDVQPLTASSETAWNNGSQGGATGGGISVNWPSPSWQANSGVPGVSTSLGRQTPDVSASADSQIGVTVYSTSFGKVGWTTIGGTSAAAPIWAAVLAEIAASGSTGTACGSLAVSRGGSDLGFVPPLLYSVASTAYASSFHSISQGSNDAFHLGLGYDATTGFNVVGGLGSPIVTNPGGQPGLASSLCAAATQPAAGATTPPAVTGIAPSFGPLAGGTTLTIALGAPLTGGATATVSIGGHSATVVSSTSTSITVLTPPAAATPGAPALNGAGPALVSVTERIGAASTTSAPSASSRFEYVNVGGTSAVPSVSDVNPSAGNLRGGNVISIFGSGFSAGTPEVTIGGIQASGVHVVSDYLLTVTVPGMTSATQCATGAGFAPSSLCQASVVVTDANGSSAAATILPVETGPLTYSPLGAIETTGSYEVAPSVTEYDYAPTPAIVAIRPNPASPRARSVVRIIGRGFSVNTFDWVNFGPAQDLNSQQAKILAISNTEIDIISPAKLHLAGHQLPGGVSVQSAAGLSKPKAFSYLGVPVVDSVTPDVGRTNARRSITVSGSRLSGVTRVQFVDEVDGKVVTSKPVSPIHALGDTSFVVRVPREVAGPYAVEPCNSVWCAAINGAQSTYTYVSAALPRIDRVTLVPSSGANATVAVFGRDLAGASALLIGRVRDTSFVTDGATAIGDPRVAFVSVPRGEVGIGSTVRIVTPAGVSKSASVMP